jgi:hypothetical protein
MPPSLPASRQKEKPTAGCFQRWVMIAKLYKEITSAICLRQKTRMRNNNMHTCWSGED